MKNFPLDLENHLDEVSDRRDFLAALAFTCLNVITPGVKFGGVMSGKTCFLYDDIYLDHDTGPGHPERPERLSSILQKLKDGVLYDSLYRISAEKADTGYIALAHSEEYIKIAERDCKAGLPQLTTGDTQICPESYDIALKAAGGVLKAVDLVMDGTVKNAFCAVRPPGHHATQSKGMGFCIFNNVAVAARYVQKRYGAERVLIADWDIHHGNGTQDIFYHDPTVFFMSTHQHPLYPGTGMISETGAGEAKGTTMNRPFPPGAGNSEIIGAFKNDLIPAMKDFKPDFTFISAGFDSREGDLLGEFKITDEGFRDLTEIMLEAASISGDGRLVSVLEGGYSLDGLSSAVYAHVDTLSKA